jgi:hypothetical protein
MNITESKRICEARTSGLTEDMTEYFNHSVQEYPEALQLLEEARVLISWMVGGSYGFEDQIAHEEAGKKWLREVGCD